MTYPQGSLISYFSTKVKQHGGINLAQGIPGFDPPRQLVEALAAASLRDTHQYPPGTGHFGLIEQLQSYLKPNYSFSPEEMLILQGATEALSLTFLYIRNKLGSNFRTLAIAPAYESYRQLPLQFGMEFTEVAAEHNNTLPLAAIEDQIQHHRVRLVFLASPGNPLGAIFSRSDIETLVQMCQQHQCFLLFDAAYSELYYSEAPFVPYHLLNPYLFIAGSFSKMFSITGWRIGWLLYDKAHTAALRTLHDYTGLCANSVAQHALADFLGTHQMGIEYIESTRSLLTMNYRFASESLAKMGFSIKHAGGGYFIWTELPEHANNGFTFAEQLYQKNKIAVVPGIHFSDKAERYIRLSIARPQQELSMGLASIRNFFQSQGE